MSAINDVIVAQQCQITTTEIYDLIFTHILLKQRIKNSTARRLDATLHLSLSAEELFL